MFVQSLWELHALFSEGVYKPLVESESKKKIHPFRVLSLAEVCRVLAPNNNEAPRACVLIPWQYRRKQ